MKIEKVNSNPLNFSDLSVGDVFVYESGAECYFIKTPEFRLINSALKNAYNITENLYEFYNDNVKVQRVNATLKVDD